MNFLFLKESNKFTSFRDCSNIIPKLKYTYRMTWLCLLPHFWHTKRTLWDHHVIPVCLYKVTMKLILRSRTLPFWKNQTHLHRSEIAPILFRNWSLCWYMPQQKHTTNVRIHTGRHECALLPHFLHTKCTLRDHHVIPVGLDRVAMELFLNHTLC